MKKLIVFSLLVLLNQVFAQDFPIGNLDEREEFANEMFEIGEYKLAIQIYDELVKNDKNSAEIQYKLGMCKMELYDPTDALENLKKAEEMGFVESPSNYLKKDRYNSNYYSFDIDFALARAYQVSSDFENASEYYKKYAAKVDLVSPSDLRVAAFYIAQCNQGMFYTSSTLKNVKITNMGSRLNTQFDDYGALVFQDSSSIIFTRKQPNKNPKSINIDSTFKEDVFLTSQRKDGKWIYPFKISKEINREDKNEYAAALYNNDQNLVISYDKGKIKEFERVHGIWVDGTKFPKKIRARSLSIADSIMIVASESYGSIGGLDLFYSLKDKKGDWSELVRLPNSLNTMFDENYPFLDPNSKTLYFSSNSEKSTGSYDVFKAAYNPMTKTWDSPENLGYPINTPRDDIYFTYNSSTNVAYYNSNKNSGFGGLDIYMVDYNYKEDNSSLLKIKVVSTDSIPKNIITTFTIVDSDSRSETILTTNENGEVTIPTLTNKRYMLKFDDEYYDVLDTSISIVGVASEFNILIKLDPLGEGKKYTLTNVQFDRDEAILRVSAYLELDKFYTFLLEHPKLAIEIAGHTELGGLDSRNKALSQARANAVKEYLIKKGIEGKRLMAVGYGSKYPISNGVSESEKGLNRRTEVILHHVKSSHESWEPYYK